MKVLISSCLLGENVKYSGGNNLSEELIELLNEYNVEIIKICPEVLAGLSIPREPAEIIENQVIDRKGKNVSLEFREGAEKTLKIALQKKIDFAILKERSPSCGRNYIYDGSFSGKLIMGQGLSTKKLLENNIEVFSEENLLEIKEKLIKESEK